MARENITIEGMSCMHCVMHIKKALDATEGVNHAEVTIGRATVDFDEASLSRADIENIITKAGYKVVA